MMFDEFLRGRGATAVILALMLLLSHLTVGCAQVPTGGDLRIVRLEERNTSATTRSLLVQVQDVSSGPIAGAEVTFTAPREAGEFEGGERQVIVLTDPQGIAVARGFQPFRPNTPADILVNARYGSLLASRTLRYNEPRPAANGWKWVAIAGAVAAAAVVAALASRKESTGAPAQPASAGPVVVQVGTPTLSHP